MIKKSLVFLTVFTVICVLLLAVSCVNPNDENPSGNDGPPSGVQDGSLNSGETSNSSIVSDRFFLYELNEDNASYTFKGLDKDNDDTQIVVPSSYQGIPITGIGSTAFMNCDTLISVSIPSSVVSIGSSAFKGCKALTSVEIPSSVNYIGMYAFADCVELTSVSIPSGVTAIYDGVFENCRSLESVELPASVTQIGMRTFYGCRNLQTIELPYGLISIDQGAFAFCESLTKIVIPASVMTIGNLAFVDCPLLTIYCRLSAKPDNWESSWHNSCDVVWGYTGD